MTRTIKQPSKCDKCGQRLDLEKRLQSQYNYTSFLYHRIAGIQRSLEWWKNRKIIKPKVSKRDKLLKKISRDMNYDRTKLFQEDTPNATFPNLKIIFDKKLLGDMNSEKYVATVYRGEGWAVTKANYGNGHPDLICTRGQDTLYIEVKRHQDFWRRNQIEWYMKNNEKWYVLYYTQ